VPADSPQNHRLALCAGVEPGRITVQAALWVNANGSDLNCNSPHTQLGVGRQNLLGKRTNKDPRHSGPKPPSEPESQFLHQQMQSFQPNLIVSIHVLRRVDFDGPSVPPSRPRRLYLDQVGIFRPWQPWRAQGAGGHH
jgi:hypothetical protein